MVKCTKGQARQLKTALRWKMPAGQRQRIQMVLLRESGMTQPLIAAAMGVSLSTVNRAHMPTPASRRSAETNRWTQRENMTLEDVGLAGALCQGRWSRRNADIHDLKAAYEKPSGMKPARARSIIFWPGTAGAS